MSKAIETKLKPNAIGIPENNTIKVNTAKNKNFQDVMVNMCNPFPRLTKIFA